MLIFVYGTLKQGFPNFHVNRARPMAGGFVTRLALPLYLVSERHTPWLVWQPGVGHRVLGELFDADESTLPALDELEGVHDPDGYRRLPLAVQAAGDDTAPVLDAMAYVKLPAQLAGQRVMSGPHAAYTAEMAAAYRRRSALRGDALVRASAGSRSG